MNNDKFKTNFFLLLIVLTACDYNSENIENKIEGTYIGDFKYGNFEIQIEFDISRDLTGFKTFFTSLEQNAYRIPTRDVVVSGDSIKFVLQSDYYTYQFSNKYHSKTKTLTGVLNVESISYPYELKKQELENKEALTREDVKFESNRLSLQGTIWLPSNPKNQGLFFVTSSGLADRSSTSSEALYFVKKGFTIFHFDKRGTGKSEGDLNNVTIEELTTDDINAIHFFSKKVNIPLSKIGIIGSSQGGAKVPLMLNKIPELGYGISVSTPGSTLRESDLNFMMNRLREQIDEEFIETATHVQRGVFEYLNGELSRRELEKRLGKYENSEWYQQLWIPELTDEILYDPSYSPIPHFEKVKHPILIVQGMSDIVIPRNSHKVIENALKKANNENFNIVTIEYASHSMTYEGESDFPYWSKLEPSYLPTILKWINTVSNRVGGSGR